MTEDTNSDLLAAGTVFVERNVSNIKYKRVKKLEPSLVLQGSKATKGANANVYWELEKGNLLPFVNFSQLFL